MEQINKDLVLAAVVRTFFKYFTNRNAWVAAWRDITRPLRAAKREASHAKPLWTDRRSVQRRSLLLAIPHGGKWI